MWVSIIHGKKGCFVSLREVQNGPYRHFSFCLSLADMYPAGDFEPLLCVVWSFPIGGACDLAGGEGWVHPSLPGGLIAA